MIDNLWMTVAALKGLSSLQEVAFCKFDNQQFRSILDDEEGDISLEARNEREAENILDLIVRRIGDMTVDEIGGRVSSLSGSLTRKIQHTDWTPLERLSRTLGISNLPMRITRLGERLESPELALFGEKLQRLSIPVAMSYLNSIRNNIASITETKASSIGQLLSSIQVTINRYLIHSFF